MQTLQRILRALLHPSFSRVRYANWEWLLMRLAFAWFVLQHTTWIKLSFHKQPVPNGIAQFVDVTWINNGHMPVILTVLMWVLIALYVVNKLPLIATSGLFVLNLLHGTLLNSQGAIHHTFQITGFILLGQILAHVYWRFHRWRFREVNPDLAKATPASSLVYLSQQMIAAAYVASGIAKLIRSQGKWLDGIQHLPVQIAKGLDKKYYDSLEGPTPDGPLPGIGQWIIDNPNLAKLFFGTGWVLEFFAFAALLNRPMLALFGLGLFTMHNTISVIMGLSFEFNKACLLIFFVNIPFWLVAAYHHFSGKSGLRRVGDQ